MLSYIPYNWFFCGPGNIAFLLKGGNLKFLQNKTNAITLQQNGTIDDHLINYFKCAK